MVRKLLRDIPLDDPAVGFTTTVLALVRLLDQSSPPLTVGVLGAPGSGRTTFLRALEGELDPQRFVTVRFSTAVRARSSSPSAALAACIEHALDTRKSDERAKAMIGQLTAVLAQPQDVTSAPTGGPSRERDVRGPDVQHRRSPRSTTLAWRHSAGTVGGRAATSTGSRPERLRVVILLDDLDACGPTELEDLLAFVHGPLGRVGVGSVLALDPACIASKAGWERVVQVTHRLPLVDRDQLTGFVDRTLAEGELDHRQIDELRDQVAPALEWVVAERGATPRALKRLINAYIVATEIDHECRLDRSALLAVLTIAARSDWWPAHDALLLYQDSFVHAIERRLAGDQEADRELDGELWLLPASFMAFIERTDMAGALLEVEAVAPYLASVEASYLMGGEISLDDIKAAGALRIALTALGNRAQSERDTAAVLAECSSLAARLATLPGAAGQPANAVLRSVRALHDRAAAPPSGEQPQLSGERLQAARTAARLAEHLLARYRRPLCSPVLEVGGQAEIRGS